MNEQITQFRIESGQWTTGIPDLHPRVDSMSLVLPLLAGDERFAPLATALRRIATYSIFPDALRQPQRYDPARPMDRHGGNWVSILKDQAPETWRADLVEVLGRLTEDIIDVSVQPVAGYLTAQFKHRQEPSSKREKWFDSAQESDGTLTKMNEGQRDIVKQGLFSLGEVMRTEGLKQPPVDSPSQSE